MIAAYGEEDGDWIGMQIELYAGMTKFKGADRETVLVRAISPGLPVAERTPPTHQRPDDIDDPF
jgi:hypothetical protein